MSSGSLTLPFGDESGERPVSIDFSKLDLAESDQSVEQRHRCLLGGEARLGLGPATQLAIQVLQRIGRAQGLPHQLGELVEGQKLEPGLDERTGDGRAELRPLGEESVVGRTCGKTILGEDDEVVVTLHLRPRMRRAMISKVARLVAGTTLHLDATPVSEGLAQALVTIDD